MKGSLRSPFSFEVSIELEVRTGSVLGLIKKKKNFLLDIHSGKSLRSDLDMLTILPTLMFLSQVAFAESLSSLAVDLQKNPEFQDVSSIEGVQLDFRYATVNNFLHQAVYGDFHQCFLHKIAARKLLTAVQLLTAQHPKWKLLIIDCLRPRRIQSKMWESVKGTKLQKYVANPAKGSMHNYGFAIDLSLINAEGKEIDMGTPFDHFGPEAEPQIELQLKRKGVLTEEQIKNRRILRSIMEKAGFHQLPIEWWHYDAVLSSQVRKGFSIVE